MVWTDVFQAVVMVMGFLAVTIEGSIQLGGILQKCGELMTNTEEWILSSKRFAKLK